MSYTSVTDAAAASADAAGAALRLALQRRPLSPTFVREALGTAAEALRDRFLAGEDVDSLVRRRSDQMDDALRALWSELAPDLGSDVALVAVGGYGRGELHPHSDIDLLLLLPDALPDSATGALSRFVTALWDLGLDIGHSARTVEECARQAADDLTVTTTLIESRLISGPRALYEEMLARTTADRVWPSTEFFAAKLKEQRARHARYDDTAYKLEPNVKGSPGGLRDIQMIGWVAKRHFGVSDISELVEHKFLTPGQVRLLQDGQSFLWRVRFALHVLAGRKEDRLLFDHQTRLAAMLGYEDARYTLGVEQLMQRYYRTVMDLSRLNEMLLQLFEEEILLDPDAEPVAVNERFQSRNAYLQTAHDHVFRQHPSALLEIFLLLQGDTELRGVSAHTVGLIKRNLYLIDENFRQDPKNHRLFLKILRAPEGVTHELRRMNLYGVLGLYIPAFGRIVGRMQYDLFHAYTVDEHTLFVVSNLRRFALTRFDHEYPHCSPLMQSFEKPEIAYLAGLFHDIAKGRGGDHSELGAVDAESFCLEHGLSQYDARTVSWLVRHHLALSMTAQKKDISDPDVIRDFAKLVGDKRRLDYLYVLTVADVRGTNPELWNSWKATLFRDLYELTLRALRKEDENPIDRDVLIAETRAEARERLHLNGLDDDAINLVWELLSDQYFLRCRSEEIAWHTQVLANSDLGATNGLVEIRTQPHGDGLEVLLYTPRSKRTFAHVTGALDQLGLTIVDARIAPVANDYSLDTYIVMELDQRIDTDDARLSKIRRTVSRVLSAGEDEVRVTRALSRQAKHFSTKPDVRFSEDPARRRTVLELVAGDRPGLLNRVGQVFIDQGIDIDTAKIVTVGERAEDVFYISDEAGHPLTSEDQDALKEKLIERLEYTDTTKEEN